MESNTFSQNLLGLHDQKIQISGEPRCAVNWTANTVIVWFFTHGNVVITHPKSSNSINFHGPFTTPKWATEVSKDLFISTNEGLFKFCHDSLKFLEVHCDMPSCVKSSFIMGFNGSLFSLKERLWTLNLADGSCNVVNSDRTLSDCKFVIQNGKNIFIPHYGGGLILYLNLEHPSQSNDFSPDWQLPDSGCADAENLYLLLNGIFKSLNISSKSIKEIATNQRWQHRGPSVIFENKIYLWVSTGLWEIDLKTGQFQQQDFGHGTSYDFSIKNDINETKSHLQKMKGIHNLSQLKIQFCKEQKPELIVVQEICNGLAQIDTLKDVTIHPQKEEQIEYILKSLQQNKLLATLVIDFDEELYHLSLQRFFQLISGFNHLRKLELSLRLVDKIDPSITDSTESIKKLTHLKRLFMKIHFAATDSLFEQIGKLVLNSQLEIFELSEHEGSQQLTENGHLAFYATIASSKTLTTLNLILLNVKNFSNEVLGHMGVDLSQIQTLKMLQIQMRGLLQITNEGLSIFGKALSLSKSLHKFDLHTEDMFVENQKVGGLAALFTGNSELTDIHLRIQNKTGKQDEESQILIFKGIGKLFKLKTLNVSFENFSTTDEVLKEMAKAVEKLPNIQTFIIYTGNKMEATDAGMKALADALITRENLKNLTIEMNNPKITYDIVSSMQKSFSQKKLKVLDINNEALDYDNYH